VSDGYRRAPVLAAFDDITAVAKQNGEQLELRVSGNGKDAAAVTQAVNMVEGGLNQAKQMMPRMLQEMPMMQPVVDFVQSLKCEAKDKSAELTGSFKGDTSAVLALPMFLFGARSVEVKAAPAQVQPVPPPPPPVQPK
jgi:hypothetical protein